MNNQSASLKGVTLVWLSKTDLSNLNAGEGGGGNVTELKTYNSNSGSKPYASGQSVRHALREAIERNNPGVFLCTPESPCCDVKNCWLCDLFGFLDPKPGQGSNRRWSPIKATPALGQIASEIVTDLLIRMSDKPKARNETVSPDDSEIDREESPDDEAEATASTDQRIAYVQIMSNVYRIGLSLDVANVGKVINVNHDNGKVVRNVAVDILVEERKKRAVAVLDAIGGISDFAKQARNAASLSPDIFIASTHSRYSHRTLRALECDDEGNVNTDTLKVILQDLQDDGATLFFGFTPDVVKNDDKLLETINEFGLEPVNPIRALRDLTEAVQNATV